MNRKAYSSRNVNQVNWAAVLAGHDGQESFVGVDVGKKLLKVVLRWPDGSSLRPWDAENPGQVRELTEALKGLAQGRPLTVAMEPTGTYADPLRQSLHQAGIPVVRISARATRDYAELYDNTPSQHDGKDAAIVAELLAMGKGQSWAWQSPTAWEQELAEAVEEMDAQRRVMGLWCGKLEGLLARHWPEALEVLRASSATLMRALAEYGGPAALARDPEAGAKLRRWGGACLKEEKRQALLASASGTVGVSMGPVDERRMKRIAAGARAAKSAGQRAHRDLQKLAGGHEGIESMAQAVGLATASVLWVCVGDPRDYPCAAAYRKAMGLNLKERSSGRYQGRLKISKRGSSMVRRWLYLAALRLVGPPGRARDWYRARRAEAEASGTLMRRSGAVMALTGVMRRLAKAVHHLGKHRTVFDIRRLFGGGRRLARGVGPTRGVGPERLEEPMRSVGN